MSPSTAMSIAWISSQPTRTAFSGKHNGGLLTIWDLVHPDGPEMTTIGGESCRTTCTRTTAGPRVGPELSAQKSSTSSTLACVMIPKGSFLGTVWLKVCKGQL